MGTNETEEGRWAGEDFSHPVCEQRVWTYDYYGVEERMTQGRKKTAK